MGNLLKFELLSRWGAIAGWSAGLTLFGATYIFILPEMGEEMAALADLSIYQALGIDLGSLEGILASSVIGVMPVMLGIYAIVTSTETLAGEEDRGTLELLVATPLPRWQIVTAKAIAIGATALFILAIAGVGIALLFTTIVNKIEIGITPTQLFFATLSAWPLTLTLLMLGLFLGAFLPSRRSAALATTAVFVASYLGTPITNSVRSLEAFRPLSLFYYFDSSAALFTNGVQARDLAVLLGLAALFFVLALLSFGRRNITVGAWPWQRPRA